MVRKENKHPNELGTRQIIDIKCLELNEGQIVGIPKNPRYLKGEEHDKLKKSLKDSPELLQYKPLMVYAIEDNKFVVICGNMRLRICQELHNEGMEGFEALPCFVLNKDVPIAKIKEYAIKDNVQAGNWDWDELAMENGKPMICRIGVSIVRFLIRMKMIPILMSYSRMLKILKVKLKRLSSPFIFRKIWKRRLMR